MPEQNPEIHRPIEQIPQSEAGEFADALEQQALSRQPNRQFFPEKPKSDLADSATPILSPEKPTSGTEGSHTEESSLSPEEWKLIEENPKKWIIDALNGSRVNLSPAQKTEGMAHAMEIIPLESKSIN